MIYVPKTPQSVASNTKDQMQDPEMQIPKCYQQIQKGIHYRRHAKHTMRLEIGAKPVGTLGTNVIRQKSLGAKV
jgi:hypothetical protein